MNCVSDLIYIIGQAIRSYLQVKTSESFITTRIGCLVYIPYSDNLKGSQFLSGDVLLVAY